MNITIDDIKEYARWHHLNEMTIAGGKTPSDSEIDFEVEAWRKIEAAFATQPVDAGKSTSDESSDVAADARALESDTDAAAKIVAEWLGFAWEGITEGSIVDRGFPVWSHGPTKFQGRRDDLRRFAVDVAKAVTRGDAVPVHQGSVEAAIQIARSFAEDRIAQNIQWALDPSYIIRLCNEIDRLRAAEQKPDGGDLVAWLNSQVNLEVTWGDIDGWEDDCQWRVHRRQGGRNDREFTLVAYGETLADALEKASVALKR